MRLIDIDVDLMHTLARDHPLSIVGFTAPKQTETTQRWKVSLRSAHRLEPFQTRIEFSRRKKTAGSSYEPIDRTLTRRYGLPSSLAQHYLAPAATAQKVAALAHRTEPQARDVFGLALLFEKLGGQALSLPDAAREDVAPAIERAMGISFDEFSGQVVAFLEEEHRAVYESRASWNLLQQDVVERLEGLAR